MPQTVTTAMVMITVLIMGSLVDSPNSLADEPADAATVAAANDEGHAPPCPDEILFEVGENLFYSAMYCQAANCTNGESCTQVLVYGGVVASGCRQGNGGNCKCLATEPAAARIAEIAMGQLVKPLAKDATVVPVLNTAKKSAILVPEHDHIVRLPTPGGDKFYRCLTVVKLDRPTNMVILEKSLALEYVESPEKAIIHTAPGEWIFQPTSNIPIANAVNQHTVRYLGQDYIVAPASPIPTRVFASKRP